MKLKKGGKRGIVRREKKSTKIPEIFGEKKHLGETKKI